MSHNLSLNRARDLKDDEFYTRYETIESEISHYREYLSGKVVYCNCDNPKSYFVKYFIDNFKSLDLKAFLATGLSENKEDVKLYYDGNKVQQDAIKDGSFQSNYELLNECDVVVTNPPFSLMREYVETLIRFNKDFIILASQMLPTYKTIFPNFKDGLIRTGYLNYNSKLVFDTFDGKERHFNNIAWFTTFDIDKHHHPFLTGTQYKPSNYKKYSNCDAINVNKIKDIPDDYYGVMGVPMTFIDKINSDEFDILGIRRGSDGKDLKVGSYYPFQRLLVKRKETRK